MKVLLVDDEADIRKIAKLSLEAVGKMQTLVAASAAEALALAASEQPDLILMDVMMPEVDGPTALGQLRADAATASIPVIFMTAKVQRAEVDHYKGLGALGVIGKPFDPMTLATEIRRIWDAR